MSSHSESEEEKEELDVDEAFQKAHYYIEKVQSILENESTRVKQEKEAFESVAKKLKHVHFSSTVKLNVGGQVFTTSLETMKKDAGSMLNAMFSGRFDTKPAEDGSYFIDRDGTHFRYILNYLRTGKLILPEDKVLKKEVLEEARFYQIQGVIDKLEPKPYSESMILSLEWRDWLKEAVGTSYDEYHLLYRASVNGWGSSAFHSLCDNKGPTLVVVKSGNYIFGGYTEESWSSKCYFLHVNPMLYV